MTFITSNESASDCLFTKEQGKEVIKNLVLKYNNHKSEYLNPQYNETSLRNEFLDQFFGALGWDIKNKSSKPTNEREVILEENLRADISENSKKPDYTFRLFSERKFFLEAKKPSICIQNNASSAKQVRRYGFTAKLKISVLSNFEYLAIYDCSETVKESDGARTGLVKLYSHDEYEKYFDEIYDYLGREKVYNGSFDETWSYIENKINLFSVDDLFLGQINAWRTALGNEIYKHQKDIKEEALNDVVQSYLNSIIFLRVCEDRSLEEYKTLLSFATKEDFKALIEKFKKADKKYNSGLFDQPLQEKVINDVKSVFWEIIKKLYYPESPYSFSVFSSDILGNIYELFLAKKLIIKGDLVVLENRPEQKSEKDIVTTPTSIIQAILKRTVIPFCNGKTDEEIFKTKFSDIACGSGAFLLETFQVLNDIIIDYYLKNDATKLIQTSIGTYKLPFEVKRKLLLSSIFGIDKDYNAVQVCKFGLLLKLLESETNATVSDKRPILPSLNNNIHFGNSLLSSGEVSDKDQDVINPFDFGSEKYDVIIGNPPYMKSEDMKEFTPKELPLYKKHYKSAFKQFDKYFLFIERGLSLLNKDGYLGFIVPNKFTKVGAAKELRKLLKTSKNIAQITSFGATQVFKNKTTYTCLLTLRKEIKDTFEYCEVNSLNKWKIKNFSGGDFANISTNSLDEESWILFPSRLEKSFKKIEEKSVSLGQLIGDDSIFNGIQTSANKIYIHKPTSENHEYYFFKKDSKEWQIEKELTRPYFQTSDGNDSLFTYRKFQPNSFVIYPYKKTSKGIEFIEINELKDKYPFANKYLQHYKKELSKPERDIKPEPKTKDEWYRYGRHQSLDKCEVAQKIIVGVLSLGNKYAIDDNRTLISSGGTAGYCILTLPKNFPYSVYYIQALLNSKYLEWYSSLIGEIFSGGYISRGTKVLKRLPIKIIDFSNKQEALLHNSISDTQKELIDIQEKIDRAKGDKRLQLPLVRRFKNSKNSLNALLKKLFQLEEEDEQIPIILEKNETN